jgi:hypothetical protein
VSGFDRYLDAYAGYPDRDAYELWLERQRQRKQAERIREDVAVLVAEGFVLSYERPLMEAPRG